MSTTATMLIPPVFSQALQPAHANLNPGFIQTVHHAIQSPDVTTMREVNRLIGGTPVHAVQVATKFGTAVAFLGRMRADVRGSRGSGNHFHILWVDGARWKRSRTTSLSRFVAVAIASAAMMIQDVSVQTLSKILPLLYARILSDAAAAIGLPFNVGAMPQRDAHGLRARHELFPRGRFGEVKIELREDQLFRGNVGELGDAHIAFAATDYTRSGFDEMFLARTPAYFKSVVDWKRAFMVCRSPADARPLVFLTHVEQPRGLRSSHITIRQGLRQLFGDALDQVDMRRLEVARGYIRPGEGDRFEVYSLSGAKMFESDGSLSEQSRSVQSVLKALLDIDVDIVEDGDVSRRVRLH